MNKDFPEDAFTYIQLDTLKYRYITDYDGRFDNAPYLYVERWNDQYNCYVTIHAQLLEDDTKPEGYRKNLILMNFEGQMRIFREKLEKDKNKTIRQRTNKSSTGEYKMHFNLNIYVDLRDALIESKVNMSNYINTAIREKMIIDGLISE